MRVDPSISRPELLTFEEHNQARTASHGSSACWPMLKCKSLTSFVAHAQHTSGKVQSLPHCQLRDMVVNLAKTVTPWAIRCNP